MAVDGRGPKWQPTFDGNKAGNTAPDQNAIGDYAALVGNRIADTSARRAAFASSFGFNPWDGLNYFETDTLAEFVYSSGAWISGAAQGWTPSIDGIANSSEIVGGYTKVGGYCIAHGFFRAADGNFPTTKNNKLNLPTDSIQYAGLPFQIGTVEYTRRSDYRLRVGRVMQSGVDTTPGKALLWVDTADSSGVGSGLAVAGSPFSIGSSDAMWFHIRLNYRHA